MISIGRSLCMEIARLVITNGDFETDFAIVGGVVASMVTNITSQGEAG